MASEFVLTARLNLQAGNTSPAIQDIARELKNIKAEIDIKLSPRAEKNINNLNNALKALAVTLKTIGPDAERVARSIETIGTSFGRSVNSVKKLQTTASSTATELKKTQQGIRDTSTELNDFSKRIDLAARRFSAFLVAGGGILALVNQFRQAIVASVDFEKQLVRLEQVGGQGRLGISEIEQGVRRLATGLGVSSKDLIGAAVTIRQAGVEISRIEPILETLAQASLSPTFESMREATEGAIAVMQQFKNTSRDLRTEFGAINAVAAQFAVEVPDLISAIQRAGGVFATTGGQLNELLAIFTSIRATTRESADAIATGLRTIFARLQQKETVDQLKDLGINLRFTRQEAERLGDPGLLNQFVGNFEAIQRISAGLQNIRETDPRFAAIVEQIGGIRQLSRVIPALKETKTQLDALSIAQAGANSTSVQAIQAQQSLANQLTKLQEKFFELIDTIGRSSSVRAFLDLVITLTENVIKLTSSVSGLIPLLTALGAIKIGQTISGVVANISNRSIKRATGGTVPGFGSRDTVPALLTPGEFVIPKDAASKIGEARLEELRKGNLPKFATGGVVQRFVTGGVVGGSSFDVSLIEKVIKELSKELGFGVDAIRNSFKEIKIVSDQFINHPVLGRAVGTFNRQAGNITIAQAGLNARVIGHEIAHAVDFDRTIGRFLSEIPGTLQNSIANAFRFERIKELRARGVSEDVFKSRITERELFAEFIGRRVAQNLSTQPKDIAQPKQLLVLPPQELQIPPPQVVTPSQPQFIGPRGLLIPSTPPSFEAERQRIEFEQLSIGRDLETQRKLRQSRTESASNIRRERFNADVEPVGFGFQNLLNQRFTTEQTRLKNSFGLSDEAKNRVFLSAQDDLFQSIKQQIKTNNRGINKSELLAFAQSELAQAVLGNRKVFINQQGQFAGLQNLGLPVDVGGLPQSGFGRRFANAGRFIKNNVAGIGLGTAALGLGLLPTVTNTLFGNINDTRRGERTTAGAGQVVGGTLTGVATGALAGAFLPIPGAAIIGGAIGGLIGFTQSLIDTTKKIRELDLDVSLKQLEKTLKNFTLGLATEQDVITNLDDQTRQIREEARRRSTSFFGGFNQNQFNANLNQLTNERLSGLTPAFNAVLSKTIDNFIQQNQDRPNSPKLLEEFRKLLLSGNSRKILEAQVPIQGSVNQQLKQLEQTFTRSQETRQRLKELNDTISVVNKNLNSFTGLVQSIETANIGFLRSIEEVDARFANLSGQFANLPLTNTSRGLQSIGTPNSTIFGNAVEEITKPLGAAGKDLANTALTLDRAFQVLPNILSAKVNLNQEDFTRQVEDELKNALQGNFNADLITERLVQGLSNPDEFSGIQTAIRRDAIGVVRDIGKEFNTILDAVASIGQVFQNQRSILEQQLTAYQQNIAQIAEIQDRVAQIEQQRLVTLNEINNAFGINRRELSFEELTQDFRSVQNRLAPGIGLDANAIGNQLIRLEEQLVRERQNVRGLENDPGFFAAARGIRELETQTNNYRRALQNLQDTTSRVAIIQDKLASIQRDEQDRFNLLDKVLTGDIDEISKLNRIALGAGRLAQGADPRFFNRQFLGEVLRSLRSDFGNIRIGSDPQGRTGGQLADDISRQLLGIANLGQPQKVLNERDQLLLDLQKVFDEAKKAAEVELKTRTNALDRIIPTLEALPKNFISELQKTEKVRSLTEKESEQATLRGRLEGAQQQFGQARFLKDLGITSGDQLKQLQDRGVPALLKTFVDVNKQVKEERADFRETVGQEAAKRLIAGGAGQGPLDTVPVLRKVFEQFNILDPQKTADTIAKSRGFSEALSSGNIDKITEIIANFAQTQQSAELQRTFVTTFSELQAKSGLNAAQLTNILNIATTDFTRLNQALNLTPEQFVNAGRSVLSLQDQFDSLSASVIRLRNEINQTDRIQNNPNDILALTLPRVFAKGGPVFRNDGGSIFKPRGTDTVPAMLTPGEFVINRKSTQRFLPLLEKINRFQRGGRVRDEEKINPLLIGDILGGFGGALGGGVPIPAIAAPNVATVTPSRETRQEEFIRRTNRSLRRNAIRNPFGPSANFLRREQILKNLVRTQFINEVNRGQRKFIPGELEQQQAAIFSPERSRNPFLNRNLPQPVKKEPKPQDLTVAQLEGLANKAGVPPLRPKPVSNRTNTFIPDGGIPKPIGTRPEIRPRGEELIDRLSLEEIADPVERERSRLRRLNRPQPKLPIERSFAATGGTISLKPSGFADGGVVYAQFGRRIPTGLGGAPARFAPFRNRRSNFARPLPTNFNNINEILPIAPFRDGSQLPDFVKRRIELQKRFLQSRGVNLQPGQKRRFRISEPTVDVSIPPPPLSLPDQEDRPSRAQDFIVSQLEDLATRDRDPNVFIPDGTIPKPIGTRPLFRRDFDRFPIGTRPEIRPRGQELIDRQPLHEIADPVERERSRLRRLNRPQPILPIERSFAATGGTISLAPRGFASGGLVDSVPSLLTPGEFVLSKPAVNRIGVDNLVRMNKGGLVPQYKQTGGIINAGTGGTAQLELKSEALGAINNLKTSLDNFVNPVTQFSTSLQNLQAAFATFAGNATRLADSLSKFPTQLEITGTQTVEVIINGAEVLSRLQPELKELIETKMAEALNRFQKDKLPGLGPITD